MFDKYSCINLGVISPINYIICFIMRYFGMLQYSSVIQFGDFGFFSMTVNLNLLGVNLGSTAEPSLCYP